ncbi:MAG: alpha/beta fold hydrolase [Glaciecola sp.]
MNVVNYVLSTLCVMLVSLPLFAKTLSSEQRDQFTAIYAPELGNIYACPQNTSSEYGFCANSLKNPQNAPQILMPKDGPQAVLVLQHGLSDSPYFMHYVGQQLQRRGYIVILPLTPGHGKKDANADMKDDNLQQRWYQHTEQVMNFAYGFDLPVFIGGFSTGGALAVQYALLNQDKISGVMLFSGALALSGAAESLANIWGIKHLAKWIDGEYETMGPHPHKYPSVAGFSALVLMDVIRDIRGLLEDATSTNTPIYMPLFVAHSMADIVTPFKGVDMLVNAVEGEHVVFKIDESYDLCHADLPMSQIQLIGLRFQKSEVNQSERCAIPEPNPLHNQMMLMLNNYLDLQLQNKKNQ